MRGRIAGEAETGKAPLAYLEGCRGVTCCARPYVTRRSDLSAKSSLRRRFVDSSIVCCDWRIVSRASASNRLHSTSTRLPNGSAEKEGTGKLVRAPMGHFETRGSSVWFHARLLSLSSNALRTRHIVDSLGYRPHRPAPQGPLERPRRLADTGTRKRRIRVAAVCARRPALAGPLCAL